MNRQEYLNKRKALITDAENLLKEGKFTEYEAKEKEEIGRASCRETV